jgi:tRNA uridine 5-carbamoylmethylation protein Kti12
MIVHLIGSPCSGKSTLIKELKKEHDDISSWDILEDFYIPLEITKNGIFNTSLYYKHQLSIDTILKIAINKAAQKKHLFILESSGCNKLINRYIKISQQDVFPVILKIPSEQETRLRVIAQLKSVEPSLQIRDLFLQKLPYLLDSLSNKYKDNDLIPKEPINLDLAKERINQLFTKK